MLKQSETDYIIENQCCSFAFGKSVKGNKTPIDWKVAYQFVKKAFLMTQSIQLRARGFAGNEVRDISKSQIKARCARLRSITSLRMTESF